MLPTVDTTFVVVMDNRDSDWLSNAEVLAFDAESPVWEGCVLVNAADIAEP